MDLPLTGLVTVLLAVLVGSCLQGAIGFGMGTVAAPIVAFVEPALLPGLLIVLALVLTVTVTLRERRAIDLHGVRVAFAGRVVGTAGGAALVVVMADRWIAVLVGVSVIAGMTLTAAGWRPRPTGRAVVLAGAASGLFGTTTAIGGPPMAIVWRHGDDERTRGTLSAFFVLGSALSALALTLAGELDRRILLTSIAVLPAMGAGLLLSEGALRILTPDQIRWTGITVSVAASSAAIWSGLA